jgi:hypothetical protein
MALWIDEIRRWNHYVDHGRALGCRTLEEYDASADETIELGTRFEYLDRRSGGRRLGYYHRTSGRFVGTTDDGVFILTHFAAGEIYVRSLPGSTYR